MKISIDDYLIIADGKKKRLVQVISTGDQIKAVVADESRSDSSTSTVITTDKTQVYCNLGAEPKDGSAFGVSIEPFLKHYTLKPWGKVYLFRDLTEGEQKHLNKMLEVTAKALTAKRINNWPIDIYVKKPKGKFDGLYTRSKDGCSITLKPLEMKGLKEIIYHEMGHSVWYQNLSNRQQYKWIKKYESYAILDKLNLLQVKHAREDVVSAGNVKDALSDASDPNKVVISTCLSFIQSNYNLSYQHVNCLLENGDDLSSVWPESEFDISELKTVISEYAMTSPEEFFAEAFRVWMIQEKLPKSIQALMDSQMERKSGIEREKKPKK